MIDENLQGLACRLSNLDCAIALSPATLASITVCVPVCFAHVVSSRRDVIHFRMMFWREYSDVN